MAKKLSGTQTSTPKPNGKKQALSQPPHSAAKDKENPGDARKAQIAVHWSKPENYHLTDTLLTLIEESVTWKVALGFDKGAGSGPPSTGWGKSLIQHCSDIAEAFFLADKAFKNNLKTSFSEHRGELGETGHGLVTTGQAKELQGGTHAANAWELIGEKFPCQSALNLSVLGVDEQSSDEETFVCWSPTPPLDDIVQSVGPLSLHGNLCDDDGDKKDILSLPALKMVVPPSVTGKRSFSASLQPSKKQKTNQESVWETAEAEHEAHIAMHAVTTKEKTTQEEIKRKSSYETTIAIEKMRLEAQDKQATADQAHQLLMMEKQIELAKIQAGLPFKNIPIDPRLG
ncbi:hypothetical protein JVU11DRAFT_7310 [Chiua virens]|nr:hypothetical protein JVU11DRAFT_7310 [Chiua virens]